MPRSIWNGTITFGMVNVPVKLYSATESKTVHFHEVHVRDGSRIEHRRVCSKEDKEVPYDDIVEGYEVSPGKYVVLESDEVKAAARDRGKVMHIEEFVEVSDIDPVYFEKTYFVGSRDDEDAYRLLHEALGRSERAGIGRFTFHDREYLVAVRSLADVLALHTMRYADEVVGDDDLDVDRPSRKPSKQEVQMAGRLIDASVQPRKTRTIDIEAFVDLAEIYPIYFDHPYFLVPVGESEGTLRAYGLLVEAMGSQDRVALGRVVLRTKEYLVAVQVRDGALALTTMLFHDEVRPTKDIPTGGKKPSKRALGDALAIIEELSTDWDPESYTDCYRERLRKVIQRKRKGSTIEVPEEEKEPTPAPDLMAALERTLENAHAGRPIREAPAEDGDLAELTRKELDERAKEAGIRGRTKMSKDELVEALAGES